ncbi:vacuolar ATP synthase proteolipid subunit [Microthyrium microscopicum]|uniref:V-type proton ATPase proteolipid subunit n=1 Tax=Microthyrium microscopicum TaxID=703497 RepID=A0A6A6USN1_9PEZI|nr:vacuolar ATP synthase proteolipid subunit [Microthyrium microscopicum]
MYPSDVCPIYAPFFSCLGCACAIIFACLGAAYGTAKSGIGIAASGVIRPNLVIQNCIPIVMAAVLAIYGLVVSVMIANSMKPETHMFNAFIHLGAGLSVGISSLAAGFTIGITGDAGVRGCTQQPRLFIGMMLMQIFSEVLGMYGMVIGLLMISRTTTDPC